MRVQEAKKGIGVLDRLLMALAVPISAFSVCQIQKGWRLSFPVFETVTIHFVLEGTGSLRVGDGPWLPFGPRSILVVPKRRSHVVGAAEGALGETCAEDHFSLLGDGLVTFTAGGESHDTLLVCGSNPTAHGASPGLFDLLREPMVETLPSDGGFQHAFDLLRAELERPRLGTQAMVEVLMKQCLIAVLRHHLTRNSVDSPLATTLHDPRMARAVLAILAIPAAPHTVESLASLAGMSRATFSERFSRTYGQGPIDFVRQVRLRIAARLLRTTDMPIKVISQSVGYTSRSYFSRAFREAYGIDPKTFRGADPREDGGPEQADDPSRPYGTNRTDA